jgi:hypothetical protein
MNDKYYIGQIVDVEPIVFDLFHAFTGRVVGFRGRLITVEDQDGDAWDCESTQVSETID